jgi:hypothetical protein
LFLSGRKNFLKEEKLTREKTDVNIEKMQELVHINWRMTIRMIAIEVCMDEESVSQILTVNRVVGLRMKKVCAKMVL